MNADLAALPHWFVYAAAAFFGGCFGSFLNVCVGRWPKELSVIRPPSRCPRCGAGIAWYDNIPVLSWFALRGKCRGCGLPISPVYPLVELVVAMIWVAAAMHFGSSLTALRFAMFCTVLLGVMLTDAAAYLVPDGFTLFGLVWAIAMSMYAYVTDDVSPFATPGDAVFGACVGAGATFIIGWLGEQVFEKEAMGTGDMTLMAMVGAHVGPSLSLLTIFLGAAVGSVVFILIVLPIGWVQSKRSGTTYQQPLVPFVIFLAPGAVIALLWGTDLIRWYRSGVMGL